MLSNLDEYDAHWGANLGYCWRRRLDARLEWRQDGILGRDLLILQAEVTLIKTSAFVLESGYHHTLTSSRRHGTNVVPLGFVGLDFIWNRRLIMGAELNLNRDLRYHYLDLRRAGSGNLEISGLAANVVRAETHSLSEVKVLNR